MRVALGTPNNSIAVMGILNVTPDSFSDGGQFRALDAALSRAEQMLGEGATWIDVGGESTRPGAEDVTVSEELDRVVPVIAALKQRFDVNVSVDTSKAAVMSAAVAAGADMINDVRALREPGALAAAAATSADVCLMHMAGQPRTMQAAPSYENVVSDVKMFLQQRMQACLDAGIAANRLWLDPGFGFGKTVEHNYQLLANLNQFHSLGAPLLIGVSRKSMLGAATGRETNERLAASISAATIAMLHGGQIIRVHDVAATVDAMKVVQATRAGEFN